MARYKSSEPVETMERAEVASRRPWRESWTARNDLNDLRMRAERNGGLFD